MDEQRRRALIESQISSTDHVRRLRGLQWRIDLERTRARNPMDARVRPSKMWDSFMDLNQALNTLVGNDCASTRATSHSAQSAKIIHLAATEYKPHE